MSSVYAPSEEHTFTVSITNCRCTNYDVYYIEAVLLAGLVRKRGIHEDVYRDPGASLYRQTILLVQYKSSSAQSAVYVMAQAGGAGGRRRRAAAERENTIK